MTAQFTGPLLRLGIDASVADVGALFKNYYIDIEQEVLDTATSKEAGSTLSIQESLKNHSTTHLKTLDRETPLVASTDGRHACDSDDRGGTLALAASLSALCVK